jgi:hypothetical protein
MGQEGSRRMCWQRPTVNQPVPDHRLSRYYLNTPDNITAQHSTRPPPASLPPSIPPTHLHNHTITQWRTHPTHYTFFPCPSPHTGTCLQWVSPLMVTARPNLQA